MDTGSHKYTSTLRKKSKGKFLKIFPKGFKDQKYYDEERQSKWEAHLYWQEELGKEIFEDLLINKEYFKIAKTAIQIGVKTNLLSSSEKRNLRAAIKTKENTKNFAVGLYNCIYGEGDMEERFDGFSKTLQQLSKQKLQVLTWPLQTVFTFIADPKKNIFLKPKITQAAAQNYNYPEFDYISKPNWATYKSLLNFGKRIYSDIKDLKPKDMIDVQIYISVMGLE